MNVQWKHSTEVLFCTKHNKLILENIFLGYLWGRHISSVTLSQQGASVHVSLHCETVHAVVFHVRLRVVWFLSWPRRQFWTGIPSPMKGKTVYRLSVGKLWAKYMMPAPSLFPSLLISISANYGTHLCIWMQTHPYHLATFTTKNL